ncbi:hypothetical protein ACFL6O_01855 [candidate division KSB1 bacterium]
MKAASIWRAAAALFFTFIITITTFNQAIAQKNGHNGNNGKTAQEQAVRIYLDHFWFSDHIKREIPYVNYVMDPKQAQVYILQTHQSTGSGGSEFTLTFVGQENFTGVDDTLQCYTGADAVEHEDREAVVDLLKMGLVRYISRTPFAKNIDINYTAETTDQTNTDVTDKWNLWVFNVRMSGNFSLQDSYEDFYLSGGFSANRTSELWKFRFSQNYSHNESRIDLDDGTSVTIEKDYSFHSLLARAINSHWSYGVRSDVFKETRENTKLSASFAPVIEYDIFPYSESTRRMITFQLALGARDVNYDELTIFSKTRETLYTSSLEISTSITEKWGSIYCSVDGIVYFHDQDINRLSWNGGFNLRLAKGLQLNVHGSVSLIHDQLYLRGSDYSDEDLLLRRYSVKTNWRAYSYVSLSYKFGSMYNNIVNPRLGW